MMRSSRTLVVLAGSAAMIAAMWWANTPDGPSRPGPRMPNGADATMPVESAMQARFNAFLVELMPAAQAAGISAATLEAALGGLAPDPQVMELAQSQPEFVKPVGEYLRLLVVPERIDTGRQQLKLLAKPLDRAEATFGVDRHVLLAIWGVESNYGTSMGGRGVVRSLATLAMADRRRPRFWRSELMAALRILEAGDIAPDMMTGSWAGAMGHTQFMPSTYLAHAVDFDGDGRRDIWGTPMDALASTANYLKASGWRMGEPWGFEAALPAGFDFALSTPGTVKTAAQWQSLGVVPRIAVAPSQAALELELLLPAGAGGPAFLVGQNFRAILRYNPAVPYALAVAHLADRIRGGAPIAAVWPERDKPLSRAEREELQRRLGSRGHETGPVDGLLGTASRAAIRAYQRSRGIIEDGYPSHDLLGRLRKEDEG